MNLLITLIIGLIIIAALVWGEGMLPFDPTIVKLIQAATVIVGALVLAQKLGAF